MADTPEQGQPWTEGWPGYERFPEELIEPVLAGDTQAERGLWAWVLGFCYHAARILARRWGIDANRVDDVVQEAMAGLFRTRDPVRTLQEAGNRRGYLYGAVHNSAVDLWRRASRRAGAVSLDAVVATIAGDDDPVADARARELEAFVEEELDRLPKNRAEVFRLHLRGLTQQEIADLTGVKFATVGTWVFRVRHHLRDCWRQRNSGRHEP